MRSLIAARCSPDTLSPMEWSELDVLAHLTFLEFCRESTRWGVGGGLLEDDGVLMWATGTWVPVLSNGAARIDATVDPRVVIERADAFFKARRRGYSLRTIDGPEDEDLRAACVEAGLKEFAERATPEMVCRSRVELPSLAADVEVRLASNDAEIADFAAVDAAAYATYGMPLDAVPDSFSRPDRVLAAPHLRNFVLYERGVPVAAAQTLASHGVAGVYWVGTVPEARGRGYGEAVAAFATNAGFDLGACANSLQASVMGEPIYRRMGYETRYHYRDFIRLSPPA